MRRLLLGIETSNPTAGPRGEVDGVLLGPGVALMVVADGAGSILGAEPLREGSRHDDALMPAIERLCARAGAAPKDLWRIAVSAGPGGYTALRIAITTAKMIAEATGCEVTAVPSACVGAWRLSPELAPAIVCLASKKEAAHGTLLPDGEYVRARAGALTERLGARAMSALEQRIERHAWIDAATPLGLLDAGAIERLRPRAVIADAYLPQSMRSAAQRIGARIVEPEFAAESVCRIGALQPANDPAALAPIYAREPDAVTQWRLRQQAGGG
ncbi:MAG: tRNA (adenosine(37)-N6)-threonylcarbamoyltransferase complex dimerization subunit type 1 TsaB [Phycisphaerales bacterium JB039]